MRRIIPAQAEHAGVLTDIAIAAKRHWNYPEAWMQIWLPSLTITSQYIKSHEVWMMVAAEKPIAYYSFDENQDDLWLDNLWVLPQYIGQGIGGALFEHAVGRCKMRGVFVLKIEADPNAQRFYERMGAQKIGEHQTQVDGEPRILPIMEIRIL